MISTTPRTTLSFNYGKKAVALHTIQYLASKYGNYTAIRVTGQKEIFSSFTLKYYVIQLADIQFFYVIRKGMMINLHFVQSVQAENRQGVVRMKNGEVFRVSRRRIKDLVDRAMDLGIQLI